MFYPNESPTAYYPSELPKIDGIYHSDHHREHYYTGNGNGNGGGQGGGGGGGRSLSPQRRPYQQSSPRVDDPYHQDQMMIRQPHRPQQQQQQQQPSYNYEYDFLKDSLIMFGDVAAMDQSSQTTGMSQQELLKHKHKQHSSKKRSSSKNRIVNLPKTLFPPHSSRRQQQQQQQQQQQHSHNDSHNDHVVSSQLQHNSRGGETDRRRRRRRPMEESAGSFPKPNPAFASESKERRGSRFSMVRNDCRNELRHLTLDSFLHRFV